MAAKSHKPPGLRTWAIYESTGKSTHRSQNKTIRNSSALVTNTSKQMTPMASCRPRSLQRSRGHRISTIDSVPTHTHTHNKYQFFVCLALYLHSPPSRCDTRDGITRCNIPSDGYGAIAAIYEASPP
ncbi:hypothetical protein TgHK011_003249 [Trichoderma gracile]|nr:hypothetical protein TgHK011_003249 [Trichoderma gracile]